MAEQNSPLVDLIQQRREKRSLEYKGARGQEPFGWGPAHVNAKIARTAMAMANIRGGAIVIGMDQVGPDQWEPNGVPDEADASYKQDQVQQWVNRRADPYVELAVRHIEFEGKGFVIIEISGFDELPVVCTTSVGKDLRQGAVYTRSRSKNETVTIQSQLEMRELLDRAISVGVQRRLEPVFAALRAAGLMAAPDEADRLRFEQQQGGL